MLGVTLAACLAATACGSSRPATSSAAVPAAAAPSVATSLSAAGFAASSASAGPATLPLPAGSRKLAIPFPAGSANKYGGGPATLVVGKNALWTSDGIYRIPASGGKVLGPFDPGNFSNVGVGKADVWTADFDNDRVRRYSFTGKLLATVKMPPGSSPEDPTVTPYAVFVSLHHSGQVARIDLKTDKILGITTLETAQPDGPQYTAYGLGSVWVGVSNINSVFRLDPRTGKVIGQITMGSFDSCGDITVGARSVWITSCLDDTEVARIDPATNKVAWTKNVGTGTLEVAADGDSVWLVTGPDPDNGNLDDPSYLLQLGPDGRVVRRYSLGTRFSTGGVVYAFGALWASSSAEPVVYRIPYPG
jgi:hypothetical protein